MTAATDAPSELRTDVLVLGGGPAGTWAAVTAAAAGAAVVLADKGYCGTSGAAASGGNNLWHVPPGPERARAVARRAVAAGQLTDPGVSLRVLDETWRRVEQLADWGYPFPVDEHGVQRRSSLQGPEYLRRMRRKVLRSGVRVLDHHPALELLVTPDGAVAGAAGIARQDGGAPWRVRAGAVVLATGGCAFLSGAFGLNVDTGDGHLMAAEVGAVLSGMEFSCAYALSPAFGNHTKGLMMQFATYYGEDGRVIPADGLTGRVELARRAAAGETIHAILDKAPEQLRPLARRAQPNYFLPLDKAGIDPFTQPYPLRFVLEGTVRGTGGLRLTGGDCATGTRGLYAAGDVASREPVTGAISGGGSYNAAWAISSGAWAGVAAASYGRRHPAPRHVLPAGTAGLAPAGTAGRHVGAPTGAVGRAGLGPAGTAARDGLAAAGTAVGEVVAAVRAEVTPLSRNFFRTGAGLVDSLSRLDDIWSTAVAGIGGTGREALRARQAAAMTAHARWMYRSALARVESRGMHRRDDAPGSDPALAHRILCGGLDEVWTAADRTAVAA
ncbi:FAD-binding protein [Plantactinospora siamensis]|uniref:L-aspartate oxidase n=1 Tax=Plantactinospora siamensis TaxID=555372 RepID=A0ABV6NU39_9ACTN